MFSKTLLDYFQNPRHAGTLPPPAITVIVQNPACGDVLHLSAEIKADRVVKAGFLVRGCTASIAAASALTERMHGLATAELALITAADLEKQLDGLPAASKHAATLCIDGVRAMLRKIPTAS